MNEQREISAEQEHAFLDTLAKSGFTIEPESMRVEGACILQSAFDGGATTIRIVMNDSSGADLAITNMTTLPHEKEGQGHGSRAIQQIVTLAQEHGLTDIRAVQVQKHNESFWAGNGFVKQEGDNRTNDHVYRPELDVEEKES